MYGGGGGTITAEEAAELHAYGVARIFRPEDGREFGLEGMIRWLLDDCAQHPRPDAEGALARLGVGAAARGGAADLPARRRARERGERAPAARARGPARAAAGSRGGLHRHRRLGQVERRRRGRLPLPARAPGAQRGPAAGRSLAPALGRGPAGRPDPHERDPRREDLRPLARHAARAPRALARGRRCGARAPGRRFRPDPARDGGDRTERLGGDRSRRQLGLRDDARVRRSLAAGEDRHARARRHDRAEQGRSARSGRRPARRAQAVAPQPRATAGERRRGAGLPDRRAALERPGARPALPGAAPAPGRRGARARVRSLHPLAPRSGRHQRADPGSARPLSRRDRRGCARLPRRDEPAGRARRRRLGLPARAGGALGAGCRGGAAQRLRGRARRSRRRGCGAICSPGRRPARATRPRPRPTRCAGVRSGSRTARRRWRGRRSRRWRCRAASPGASSRATCAARTCRGTSRSRPACFRSSARARIRRACSRARARPSAPTAASICCAPVSRPCGSRPPSTARPCMAAIPKNDSTSGARSATRACRSARSTTPRSSTRASTSAIRRPPSR